MLEFFSLEVLVRIGLIVGVAIVLSVLYSMAIRKLLSRNAGKKKSQTIYKLLLNIGRYVTWFIAALIILETLNVQTAPILASAGVLGIAVGFGAQSIVMDMIAGFFILFEETFLVGEVIEVQGFRGEVIEIGLRTTKIKSWDGTLKVFTNGDIKAVSNFSRFHSVAQVEFQVSYETNLSTLSKVLEPFLTAYTHEQLIEPPTFIGVTNLTDSGITCMITCACKPNSHFGVTRDIRSKLKTHLDQSGIQIPYRLSMVKEKSSS
jgi:moderate conductance mechanosensitive channel